MCLLHADYQDPTLWMDYEMTYQEKAFTFAQYGDPAYPFASVAEEAGEVLGHINKAVRKSNGSTHSEIVQAIASPMTEDEITLRKKVIKELGDLQWNVAACCSELGITLEDIQNDNINKLSGRKIRGTINGEGDER